MGAVYAEDGTYLGGFWPTWDAHHFYIERRAEITDEAWAQILADPDWNDHAREDLRAERVCDWCLTSVARGHHTVGSKIWPHNAARLAHEASAQAELTKRGVSWRNDAPSDPA